MITVDDVVTLQIEPTSYCNAKCPHCPRFDTTHHDVFESTGRLHPDLTLSHLDISAVLANLDLDMMHNLSEVIIEGDKGDPMMHPEIERFIDAFCLSPNRPTMTLTTNGSIRNSKWWAKLAQKNYENLQIRFSIDGLADTNHLYRVGLEFDRIMENASAFIDHGGMAIWKMLIFQHNHHQIAEIEKLSRDMGFAAFHARPCHSARFKGQDRWPVIVGQDTHFIRPIDHDDVSLTFGRLPVVNKRSVPVNKKRLCPNLSRGHLYITHQHHVLPCCMMHFDTQLRYPGTDQLKELCDGFENIDLSLHPLSDILKSDFYSHNLRDSLLENQWHETCAKSCRKEILINLGNHHDISD